MPKQPLKFAKIFTFWYTFFVDISDCLEKNYIQTLCVDSFENWSQILDYYPIK